MLDVGSDEAEKRIVGNGQEKTREDSRGLHGLLTKMAVTNLNSSLVFYFNEMTKEISSYEGFRLKPSKIEGLDIINGGRLRHSHKVLSDAIQIDFIRLNVQDVLTIGQGNILEGFRNSKTQVYGLKRVDNGTKEGGLKFEADMFVETWTLKWYSS